MTCIKLQRLHFLDLITIFFLSCPGMKRRLSFETLNWLHDLSHNIPRERCHDKGSCQKNPFFWDIFPKSVYPPTHPRVFVRFGRTKGEIRVEKGDFRGNLGGFWGVWTLFGNQPPHPPTFGKDPYLIFVIFFTLTHFESWKFYTRKVRKFTTNLPRNKTTKCRVTHCWV